MFNNKFLVVSFCQESCERNVTAIKPKQIIPESTICKPFFIKLFLFERVKYVYSIQSEIVAIIKIRI